MNGRDRLLLLTLAAFVAGGLPVAPLAASACLAGGIGALIWRRLVARRDLLLVAIVCAGSAGRGLVAQHRASALYGEARRLAAPPRACALSGTVAGSPQRAGDVTRFMVEVDEGRCGELAIARGTRVALSARTSLDLVRGDAVRAAGKLAAPSLFENPGQIPAWTRLARSGSALGGHAASLERVAAGRGLGALVDRARNHVRARIEAGYHPDAVALGRALVLGESDLEPSVAETFRATGLSHVLAVSGTHLVVAVLGVAELLRRALLRTRLALRLDVARVSSLAAIGLAWLYADFAGGSGSVVRAAAMLSALLAARVAGRKPDATRAFAFALGVGVALDPVVLADVSFALSTAATWGLMALKDPIARALGASSRPQGRLRAAWTRAIEPAATTLAATVACAPVSILLSGRLSIVGVFANVLAAPLGEACALPFALAHALLAPVPALERGAAQVASGALRGVLAVARVAEGLPLSFRAPTPSGVHWAVLGVLALLHMTRLPAEDVAEEVPRAARSRVVAALRRVAARLRGVAVAGVALAACELGSELAGRPRGLLRVTALDVGQGDAILIDLPDGSAMLIDAGGLPGQSLDVGARVVAPVLAARRRRRLDVVVLSHPHPDHFGGLPGALASVEEVGEFWENGASEPPRGAIGDAVAIAREKGARLVRPSELCGHPRERGGAVIEVLAPCPGLDPSLEANDGSFVLRIRYGRRAALLVGDAEREAELRLLDSGADLRADLLKVGHHGSRTSTSPEFLRAVSPSRAIVSCGAKNRFGHPHPETLRTLDAAGVQLARTDEGGAQTWTTDGDEVW